MQRRNFLKGMLYSSASIGSGAGLLLPSTDLFAATPGNTTDRTLVNIMMLGGADLRYLFVPQPGTAYADTFWTYRKQLYQNTKTYSDYNSVWSDLYLPTTYKNMTFGIHKSAAWLKTQFDLGNVAIIANVVASTNRRHDHSQLIMHTGDLSADQYILDRDGWGGRLMQSMGNGVSNMASNVTAMSHDVPIYTNSTHPGNRLDHSIHMRDSRNFTLPQPNRTAPASQRSVMARTLKAYYEKRGEDIEQRIQEGELPQNWPYRRFFQHEQVLRQFGDSFAARMDAIMPVQPYTLQRLYKYKNVYRLNNTGFGRQIANLYDALLGSDLLAMRSAYLEISSWDTHRAQQGRLEKNLHDVFGTNGGLDSLTTELDKTIGINENLVYTFTSDFGRQIAANGDKGTDHGEGSYSIVIGRGVRGGTYGEMFPQREITPGVNGKMPYELRGADIKGLTSFERVLGEVCDWLQPGSGISVFPNTAMNDLTQYPDGPILESGVDLSMLFKPGHGILGKIEYELTSSLVFADMQVTIQGSNDSGAAKTVPVNNKGVYWADELADGSYIVTPSKEFFNFDPPNARYSLLGDNVENANFTAVPMLHIAMAIKSNAIYTRADGTQYRAMRAFGFNFIPASTRLAIDGVDIEIRLLNKWIMYIFIPVEITTGQITITTPDERYTHPVLFENIQTV